MSHPQASRAIVLLSGGLDSSTCLALAQLEGRQCSCLTIEYGQRHEAELHAARRVAQALGVSDHRFVHVDLGSFGGSALTADIPVPKDNGPKDNAAQADLPKDDGKRSIPVTYVPARNTVFLSLALAFAEVEQAQEIWIGVNAVDYSGYPDCRPEFIQAFENLAKLATKVGVEEGKAPRIITPLIDLSKADIIQRGMAAGLDYSITLTCYDPDEQGRACAHCEACTLRRGGFREAKIPDPTLYRLDRF